MSKLRYHHLKPSPGSSKSKLRKGRGESGKRGKTAGRGTKGTGAEKLCQHTLKEAKSLYIEEFQNLEV